MGVFNRFITIICIVSYVTGSNQKVIRLAKSKPVYVLYANKSPKSISGRANTVNELLSLLKEGDPNDKDSSDSDNEATETPIQKNSTDKYRPKKNMPNDDSPETNDDDKDLETNENSKHHEPNLINKYSNMMNNLMQNPNFDVSSKVKHIIGQIKPHVPYIFNSNENKSNTRYQSRVSNRLGFSKYNNQPDRLYNMVYKNNGNREQNINTRKQKKDKYDSSNQNKKYSDKDDESSNNRYAYYDPSKITSANTNNFIDLFKKLSYVPENNTKRPKKSNETPTELDLFQALMHLLSIFATYITNDDPNKIVSNIQLLVDHINENSPRNSYEVENYPDNYNELVKPNAYNRNKAELSKWNKHPPSNKKAEKNKDLNKNNKGDNMNNNDLIESYSDENASNSGSEEDYNATRQSRTRTRSRQRQREALGCELVLVCSPECYYKCV